MNSNLIIRTCRHILPTGRHCLGAAVRGRSCCRHHLMARTRLHNMARARRCSVNPRLRVPESLRDLALNQAEVSRVLATERIDPDAARMMVWAMEICATAFRAECSLLPRDLRPSKPNQHYHLPPNSLFTQGCTRNPMEVLENTTGEGEGTQSSGHWNRNTRIGSPGAKRVGFQQPRRGATSPQEGKP